MRRPISLPPAIVLFSIFIFLPGSAFAESPMLDYECDVRVDVADELECIEVDFVGGTACEREITFDNGCVDELYVLEQDCDDDAECSDLTLAPNETFSFVLEADEDQRKSLRRFMISEVDHDGIVEVSLTYYENNFSDSPDDSSHDSDDEDSDFGGCSTTQSPAGPLSAFLLAVMAIGVFRRTHSGQRR